MSRPVTIDLGLEGGPARQSVWETERVQIMRVRLGPGEALPHHESNADVVLVPLRGRVRLETAEGVVEAGVGQAAAVPVGTPMDVSNPAGDASVFLVLKTPHPRTLAGRGAERQARR